MGHRFHDKVSILLLFSLVFLLQCQFSRGWWFSRGDNNGGRGGGEQTHDYSNEYDNSLPKKLVSEFSMKAFEGSEGLKLIEDAQQKMLAPNSCWQRAYQRMFAECSKVVPSHELKSRLSWYLTDCFQQHSGRDPLPECDPNSGMIKCLKKLDDSAHKVYLEFFLQTESICHQLQMHAFRHDTERLVNELKKNANFAWEKLEDIAEKGEIIMQSSDKIQDSLASVDHRTKELERASKNVQDRVIEVLMHSESIHKQSVGIAESQKGLTEGQAEMKVKIAEGIAMVHESYNNLDKEINVLKNEAKEIEEEIGRVGEEMFSKMKTLQGKADDIENIAEVSLDKQKQLLNGQSTALDSLHLLNKFLSQALEENRGTLQELAEIGQKQQEELLQKQEQLQQAHDHLVENSKTILAAQEAFESKQASMFVAIDKLFALHNAILLESRLIKAFLVYSLSIFLLYMFTSMKQTYNVRPRLYIGLCATFMIELLIVRYGAYDIERQTWIVSIVRSLFIVAASFQLLYAIWTHRDYEMLNHEMLLTLIEKVNRMQQKHKEISMVIDGDSDDETNWSLWVDSDLPEDVNELDDPDFKLHEEVAENSIINSALAKRYNLRNRH